MPRPPISIDKIQQEAREAARHFPDLNAACPYPFSSDEGWIFRAAFIDARSALLAHGATPGLAP